MNSLADYFTETEMAIAIITETWFYKCEALEQLIIRAESGDGLGMINNFRSKRKTNANPGGGVSIVYRKSKMEMKRVQVNVKGQEICVAEGKLLGQSRPVYVVGCYLSTRLTKNEAKMYMNILSDVIGELETKNPNAEMVVAGDFNRVDMSPMLDLHQRLQLIGTPPTRREAHLDLMATTLHDDLKSIAYAPPLEPDEGQPGTRSDHDFLMCCFTVATRHEFKDCSFMNRVLDMQAKEKYIDILSGIDWEGRIGRVEDGVDQYTEAFHQVVRETLDQAAPEVKRNRKSTDKPWVTDNFKRIADRRKRLFRTEGRSADWRRMKAITTRMSDQKKLSFYENEAERLAQSGSHQLPYSALEKIGKKDGSDNFDVGNLWPEKTRKEVLATLAEYFAGISKEFTPLPETLSESLLAGSNLEDAGPDEEWTRADTQEEFNEYKIPKTTISIDPPPKFLREAMNIVVQPVTKIYRAVLNGATWPRIWKKEEASIIPKNSSPSSLEELRSISCTSVFSKILETVMLRRLRSEISLDVNQFGGQKGCGTTHLLAELNTRIMEDLDTPGTAVGLLAVDFSKAFNRMDHRACIRALYNKGASRPTLEMVAGFLKDRVMMVKVAGDFSEPHSMPGGAPQGTCSGNYLFSATVDGIETEEFQWIHRKRDDQQNRGDPDNDVGSSPGPDEGDGPHTGPPSPGSDARTTGQDGDREVERQSSFSRNCIRMPRGPRRAALDSSPPTAEITQEGVERALSLPPTTGAWTVKYVDDFTATQVLKIDTGIGHVTTMKEKREVHAGELQKVFDRVLKNAALIGMEVHPGKTKLLCISASTSCDLSAFIYFNGTKISSSEELKILGTVVSRKPNQWANVRYLRRKFAAKMWSLKRLRQAKIPQETLVRVYVAYLRPILEYAMPSHYSMMTGEQMEQLERAQRTALKTIFGYRTSYRRCLESAKLQKLAERAEELLRKFALKTYTNQRFTHEWFPERRDTGYSLRRLATVEERRPGSERLKRAPIDAMRRVLNNETELPDRDYCEDGRESAEGDEEADEPTDGPTYDPMDEIYWEFMGAEPPRNEE